jgi:phosphodiesterase/alkaline phosphatase D-like protein
MDRVYISHGRRASIGFAAIAAVLSLGFASRQASAGIAYSAVAAGDATSNDAILWTRALDSTTPAAVNFTAQVSTDPNFGTIAATLSRSPYLVHIHHRSFFSYPASARVSP